MRALRYDRFGGEVSVVDVPDPQAEPDGAVVDVVRTGLCRSDWHAWMGHDSDIVLPHTPGHEFSGVVRSAPADPRLVGRRVVVPFVCACGTCPECRAGQGQVCRRQRQPGFSDPGSFAEQVAVPHARRNLVPLPDGIGDDAAASLGCRFATAWRALTGIAQLRGDECVFVLGGGGVGLAATMIAVALGARVVVADTSPAARALVERFGASTIPVESDTPAAEIADRLRQRAPEGADVSVDAVGSALLASAGILALRRRGRHVQVGLLDANLSPLPLARIVSWELTVGGSHGMAATDYPGLLEQVGAGALRPELLVTATIGLAEAAAALPAMAAPGAPAGVRLIDPAK